MEAYTRRKSFKLANPLSDEDEGKLRKVFPNDEGIRIVNFNKTEIEVEFNIYLYLDSDVASLLDNEGFAMVKKKESGFLMKKLAEMAESNKKNLGGQKLDCCRLPK